MDISTEDCPLVIGMILFLDSVRSYGLSGGNATFLAQLYPGKRMAI